MMKRKRAFEVLAPRRHTELNDLTKIDIDHCNETYAPVLMFKYREIVREHPELEEEFFEKGKSLRTRIFADNKLPAPKLLVTLCRRLNCVITFYLSPYIEPGERYKRSITFTGTLSMSELLSFMHRMHRAERKVDTKQMIKVRQQILDQLENPNSHLHFATMVRFFNACGYQISMFIGGH